MKKKVFDSFIRNNFEMKKKKKAVRDGISSHALFYKVYIYKIKCIMKFCWHVWWGTLCTCRSERRLGGCARGTGEEEEEEDVAEGPKGFWEGVDSLVRWMQPLFCHTVCVREKRAKSRVYKKKQRSEKKGLERRRRWVLENECMCICGCLCVNVVWPVESVINHRQTQINSKNLIIESGKDFFFSLDSFGAHTIDWKILAKWGSSKSVGENINK